MKILYVMPSILHPTLRGELRHYHFLTRLARRHEITLIVLDGNDVPAPVIDELKECTRHLVRIGPPPPRRLGPPRRPSSGRPGRAMNSMDPIRAPSNVVLASGRDVAAAAAPGSDSKITRAASSRATTATT
jgi:hypothetical protein